MNVFCQQSGALRRVSADQLKIRRGSGWSLEDPHHLSANTTYFDVVLDLYLALLAIRIKYSF